MAKQEKIFLENFCPLCKTDILNHIHLESYIADEDGDDYHYGNKEIVIVKHVNDKCKNTRRKKKKNTRRKKKKKQLQIATKKPLQCKNKPFSILQTKSSSKTINPKKVHRVTFSKKIKI